MRVVAVECGKCSTESGRNVAEHDLVDVDAAQPFQALRRSQLQRTIGGEAHDDRIECAATKVVDSNRVTGAKAAGRGVVAGSRHGFADQFDLGETCLSPHVAQEVQLELAPIGRMSQHHCGARNVDAGRRGSTAK